MYEIVLPTEVFAPISKGQVVGMVTYKMNDEVLFECEVVASDDVRKIGIIDGECY